MASLLDFSKRIKPHIGQCPEATIIDTSRVILSEICNQTELWLDEPQTVYFPEEINKNTLATPQQASVANVVSVLKGNYPLSSGEIPKYKETGTPFRWNYKNGYLTVFPIPNEAVELTVTTSLKPCPDCTDIPDPVYERVYEFLPWGVLAELQMIPGKPWSDPNASQFNRNRYRIKLNELRIQSATGGNTVRVPKRRFT